MDSEDKNATIPAGAGSDPQGKPVSAAPPVIPVHPPQYDAQPRYSAKKPQVSFDKSDSLFSAIALTIGFLFCEFILFGGLGLGVVFFFITAYAGILFYGHKSLSADIKKGAVLFIPIILLLLCFVLFNNMVLNVLNFGFVFFLATLQLMSMFGMREHEQLSKGLFYDFFNGFISRPLMNLDKLFVIAAKGTKDEKGKRLFSRILLGVIISVPLLAVILSLLASADLAFEEILDKLYSYIGGSIWEYFAKILLGFGIAIPLFGAFYAFRYKNKSGSLKMPVLAQKLDRVIAYTILSVVNVIYILFLAVQFNYMFFAFSGKLPGGFIYSDYARRGFFELVAIAVINLGLLLVFYLFSSRKESLLPKPLKAFLLVLSSLTIVILGSALSKMIMYMGVFGLTQLRVYTTWFMILTAVIFLLAIAKIISRKFNAPRFACVFFTVWFLMLNFAGADAQITKYNIAKSEQDKSVTLDVAMFNSLSDSTVPYAIKLLKNDDVVVRFESKLMLTQRYDALKNSSWQSLSVASYKAKRLLEEKKASYYIPNEPNGAQPLPETDTEMVYKYLPKLTEIENCAWNYERIIFEESFGTNNNYNFYGFVVLKEAYFDKVVADYEWTPFLFADKQGIPYMEDLSANNSLDASEEYTKAVANDEFLITALDRANRKLYFYLY